MQRLLQKRFNLRADLSIRIAAPCYFGFDIKRRMEQRAVFVADNYSQFARDEFGA